MDTYGLYALVAVLAIFAVYAIRQVVTGRWRWSGGKGQSEAEKRRILMESQVTELTKGRPADSDPPRCSGRIDSSDEAIEKSAEEVLRRMRKPRQ